MNTIPIFKSHYSIGRSILTLEKKGKTAPNNPYSIIDIAHENKMSQLFLIDDSFSGFLEAYKNLSDIECQLIFGLRLTCAFDETIKTEESLLDEHRIIILARNFAGYQKLINIYTQAATNGVYYVPRISLSYIKKIWSDDLDLWIPFYDSYLHNNLLKGYRCVPIFEDIKPTYLVENNGIPFDTILQKHIDSLNVECIKSKHIYYKHRKDFKSYLTFRCISNRSTLDKPEFRGMCSNEFCVESWKETNENNKSI